MIIWLLIFLIPIAVLCGPPILMFLASIILFDLSVNQYRFNSTRPAGIKSASLKSVLAGMLNFLVPAWVALMILLMRDGNELKLVEVMSGLGICWILLAALTTLEWGFASFTCWKFRTLSRQPR